jgi:hypothetical protein
MINDRIILKRKEKTAYSWSSLVLLDETDECGDETALIISCSESDESSSSDSSSWMSSRGSELVDRMPVCWLSISGMN